MNTNKPTTATKDKKPTPRARDQDRQLKAILAQADNETIKAMLHILKAHKAKSLRWKDWHFERALAIELDIPQKMRARITKFVYGEVKR